MAGTLVLAMALPVLAHEEREVDGYQMVVGMIAEPVIVGQKSGLEFLVTQDGSPVTGLADTLQAEAIFGSATRPLTLSPRFGEDGWYESYFFPTAAGAYTFHIFGNINGTAIDETFTASPDGFGEVEEAAANQFPEQLPAISDVAADASRGAAAADQMTLALLLGGAGVVLGVIAIGLAVALRRRPA
jgi:hypothetical protein